MYEFTDKLEGTEVIGDPTNDLFPWGIEFKTSIIYDQLLLTTNDNEIWVIINKSDITEDASLRNLPCVKSSINPTSCTFKLYYRTGTTSDPIIYLTGTVDALYSEARSNYG